MSQDSQPQTMQVGCGFILLRIKLPCSFENPKLHVEFYEAQVGHRADVGGAHRSPGSGHTDLTEAAGSHRAATQREDPEHCQPFAATATSQDHLLRSNFLPLKGLLCRKTPQFPV